MKDLAQSVHALVIVPLKRVCKYRVKRNVHYDSSVEKHFQEGTVEPQISPLRCASVEMTKGRAVLRGTVVAEQKPFFITLGGPLAHYRSGWDNKYC
jgi:hypothetical protein